MINSSKALIVYINGKHFVGCFSKCHIMYVTRKRKAIPRDYIYIRGQTLSTVDAATFLVVELSPDLTWNNQVENVAAKANRTCGFIRRTVIKSSFESKMAACKPQECPKMEYSTSTTDPHTLLLIYKLERVQHYSVHWGTRERNGMATVTAMLAKLVWETLKVRKSTKRLAIFDKMLNNLIGHSDNPTDR